MVGSNITKSFSTREQQVFSLADTDRFRERALRWADANYPFCAYLDGNGYDYPFGTFPKVLAVGQELAFQHNTGDFFPSLRRYHEQQGDWLFGFFSYDLKNEVEPQLFSDNTDGIQLPEAAFFRPLHLLFFDAGSVTIASTAYSPLAVFAQIAEHPLKSKTTQPPLPKLQAREGRAAYLAKVAQIINHIIEGDVYELNYCQELFAEKAQIDPVATYEKLNRLSPTPFSAYFKQGKHHLMCASPERFLKKEGRQLVSQPIKGTVRRGSTPAADRALQAALLANEKERAENLMIVDLVRNDLARSATIGSVTVDELFGIYGFSQVSQMISTVSAQLKEGMHFTEAIKNAFPMGSMTGAPKIKAMELIEQYEESRRGLYSGAVGYITPNGNFDFNVVIRSLIYHAASQYLSCHVGSAITYDSVAEREYEECQLKAAAILKVLAER